MLGLGGACALAVPALPGSRPGSALAPEPHDDDCTCDVQSSDSAHVLIFGRIPQVADEMVSYFDAASRSKANGGKGFPFYQKRGLRSSDFQPDAGTRQQVLKDMVRQADGKDALFERMTYYLDANDINPPLDPKPLWLGALRDPGVVKAKSFYFARDCICLQRPGVNDSNGNWDERDEWCKDDWWRKRDTTCEKDINYCYSSPSKFQVCSQLFPAYALGGSVMMDFFCGTDGEVCGRNREAAPGPGKMNMAVANLKSNYLWVGVYDQMEQSLQLLSKLVPSFFGSVDVKGEWGRALEAKTLPDPQNKDTAFAACDCSWASPGACNPENSDDTKCFTDCCADVDVPEDAPEKEKSAAPTGCECSWSSPGACNPANDDGTKCFPFCCADVDTELPETAASASPAPSTGCADCSWATPGACNPANADGSKCFPICCADVEAETTPANATNSTGEPSQCECAWASPGACNPANDDGSKCFPFCCADVDAEEDAPSAPGDGKKPPSDSESSECNCSWASPGACNPENDDGTQCFPHCCEDFFGIGGEGDKAATGRTRALRLAKLGGRAKGGEGDGEGGGEGGGGGDGGGGGGEGDDGGGDGDKDVAAQESGEQERQWPSDLPTERVLQKMRLDPYLKYEYELFDAAKKLLACKLQACGVS